MSTKDEIRDTLKSLLRENGKKNYELAEHLNVSRAAVSNWLNGSNSIDMELVPSICDFFNISVDEFFGRSKPSSLNPEEKRLLDFFAALSPDGKSRLLDEAEMMSESSRYGIRGR